MTSRQIKLKLENIKEKQKHQHPQWEITTHLFNNQYIISQNRFGYHQQAWANGHVKNPTAKRLSAHGTVTKIKSIQGHKTNPNKEKKNINTVLSVPHTCKPLN